MMYLLLILAAVVVVFLLLKKKKGNSIEDSLSEIVSDKDETTEEKKENINPRLAALELELIRAGFTLNAKQFIQLRLFTTIAVFVLMLLLTKNPILGFIATIIWFFIPKIALGIAKERKKKVLEAQIPVALSLIRNSVEAGFSFLQSLEVVAQEMEAPISEEFARVLHENNLGKDLEVCLWNMVERCQSDELKLVVTAVLIQRQVGGNLGEILDVILETIKDRIQIKGEIRTLTSQGRLSATVISLLPLGLGVIMSFINPTYMEPLFTTTFGQVLIGVAVFLELLGIFFISKIIKIDF